jgi:hypothetical protein
VNVEADSLLDRIVLRIKTIVVLCTSTVGDVIRDIGMETISHIDIMQMVTIRTIRI